MKNRRNKPNEKQETLKFDLSQHSANWVEIKVRALHAARALEVFNESLKPIGHKDLCEDAVKYMKDWREVADEHLKEEDVPADVVKALDDGTRAIHAIFLAKALIKESTILLDKKPKAFLDVVEKRAGKACNELLDATLQTGDSIGAFAERIQKQLKIQKKIQKN